MAYRLATYRSSFMNMSPHVHCVRLTNCCFLLQPIHAPNSMVSVVFSTLPHIYGITFPWISAELPLWPISKACLRLICSVLFLINVLIFVVCLQFCFFVDHVLCVSSAHRGICIMRLINALIIIIIIMKINNNRCLYSAFHASKAKHFIKIKIKWYI